MRISDWSSDVCSSDLFVPSAMADQSCSLLLRTVFQERPVGLPRRATLGHWRVSSPHLATIASSFAIAPPGFGRHAFCGLETSCAAHEALRPFPMYPVPAWRCIDRKGTRLNSCHYC